MFDKKSFLGIEIDKQPHKIVSELVDFMLKTNTSLNIDELTEELSKRNTKHNLRSRIHRCLTNTPDIVNNKTSEQSRIFSIPLQYENIVVFNQGETYLLKLTNGDKPIIRERDYSEKDLQYYMERKTNSKNDVKKEFENWLRKNTKKGSNKADSYLNAIDLLNQIQDYNIYEISDSIFLKELYDDLLKEQKKVHGKYYVEDSPSYGLSGFYSASVGKFLEFLNERSIKNNDPILNLIENYKLKIKQTKIEDEIYKWEFVEENKGKPDLDAQNFEDEIKSIKWNNLVYHLTVAVLNRMAQSNPNDLRQLFTELYDDSIPIEQRIKSWQKNVLNLYRKTAGKHSHHQDERAISVYLTLHDPEKFTLYKNSYYIKFCELLGEKPKKKWEKYLHYMELIYMLVDDYLLKDRELIDLLKNIMPDYYDGSNNLLVAQDILFQMLDQEEEVNYWIFQGSPKIYDLQSALNAEAVKTWTVSAHKNKIKSGDKVILWLTGENSGCYALAKVITPIKNRKDDEEEVSYYIDKPENVETPRVGIEIEYNLADAPILWDEIKDLEAFQKFNGGSQGTNFHATHEEYDTLLSLLNSDVSSFEDYLSNFDEAALRIYFSFLFEALDRFDIKKGDSRLHYSTRSGRLSFVIGQRYSWALYNTRNRNKFAMISYDQIRPESTKFNKRFPHPYYTTLNEINFSKKDKSSIYKGFDEELKRTKKSSFRIFTNKSFEDAVFDPSFRDRFINTDAMETKNEVLNKILYGPPGTGKTYTMQKNYFNLFTVKETSLTKTQYLENIIAELSWWQVISIAVFDLGTSKVGDIFNHEFVQIKANLSNSKTIRPTIWGQLQSHTVMNCQNVNVSQRSEPLFFFKDENSNWTIDKDLLEENYPEAFELLEASKNFIPNADKEIKNYEFVTFHQSFGYEDFVEGIKPKMEGENNELSYEIKDGVFKKLCLKAKADPYHKYAIFIDEINRGNVSAIFGELITLIEKDKRLGAANELTVILPYSKEPFGVPGNIYIFGTMNTADRSVEALDTALRRRFSFDEIMPKPELVEHITFKGFNMKDVLETINHRIEVLLDRDHTIGHSYFIDLEKGDTKQLNSIFFNSIIPLLQEYFYHDYEKIALILGEGFVETRQNGVSFAKFKNLESPDIQTSYQLKPVVADIESAVKTLLNINE